MNSSTDPSKGHLSMQRKKVVGLSIFLSLFAVTKTSTLLKFLLRKLPRDTKASGAHIERAPFIGLLRRMWLGFGVSWRFGGRVLAGWSVRVRFFGAWPNTIGPKMTLQQLM